MTDQTISASAPWVRLEIDRGSETTIPLLFVDPSGSVVALVTLGYAARMAMRDVDRGTVLLSLTTANTRLALANSDPNITATIAATDTKIGTAFDGIASGIWDLYLDPDGVQNANSYKLVGGPWSMGVQVTP